MLNIGRVCTKIAGRDAGKIVVVVDQMEKNFVIVDGQVKRKRCNIMHLEPTEKEVKIKKGAGHADIIKALESLGIKEEVHKSRTKKTKNKGREPFLLTMSTLRRKRERMRSGKIKYKLFSTNTVQVYDLKEKKYYKATIESVVESPSNSHYIRRNIMTKGSVIKTDKGIARITSRPGQEGHLNAILLKK